MKKVKIFLGLVLMCVLANVTVSNLQKVKTQGKFWVGVTYLAAEAGHSNEKVAAIGVLGVAHTAMEGAVWGAVIGGPAGVAAGVVAGL